MKKIYAILTLSAIFMVGCNTSETEEQVQNHREEVKEEVVEVVEVVKEPTTYQEKIDQLLNNPKYNSMPELEKRQLYIDEVVEFAKNVKASSNEQIIEWLESIRSDYEGQILHLEAYNYRIALERVFKIQFAMRVFEKGNTEVKNFDYYMYHFYRGSQMLVHNSFLEKENDVDGKYKFMGLCTLMATLELEKEETNNQ